MFHITGVYRKTGHFLYQRYLLIISRSYVAVFLRLSFWLLWQQLYWQSIYPCDGEGVAESPKPQLKYCCGTEQWAAYTYILVSDRNTNTHTHCTSSQIHIHKYKYTNTNTPKPQPRYCCGTEEHLGTRGSQRHRQFAVNNKRERGRSVSVREICLCLNHCNVATTHQSTTMCVVTIWHFLIFHDNLSLPKHSSNYSLNGLFCKIFVIRSKDMVGTNICNNFQSLAFSIPITPS